jgi:Ser/Thr protein kinase RdoA (MazF antagonist)
VYDLACAWEGGVGWARYRPLKTRIDFMTHYMEQVMAGYSRENTLSEAWMQRLPLFLRLVQMQELIYFAQYLDGPDEDIQGGLRYKIRCIEEELPYLGFFDPGFNPEKPFRL